MHRGAGPGKMHRGAGPGKMFSGVGLVIRMIIAFLVSTTSADSSVSKQTTSDGQVDGIKYLTKYGYLDLLKPNKIQHPDVIPEAIREFQKFNGLPVTGKLDQTTIDKMKEPRCGIPDKPKPKKLVALTGYEKPGAKWSKQDLTYTIVSYTGKLDPDEQVSAVANAFKKWSDITEMRFLPHDGQVDIEIGFNTWEHGDGQGNSFDGRGGTLAHAFYPGDQAIAGDAHFDDDEDWTIGSDEGINFEIVAAHEFGHVLGLDHSPNSAAIMAPYYQGYDPNYSLHADDIRSIKSLYGSWLNPSNATQTPELDPTKPQTLDPTKPPALDPNPPPAQDPNPPPAQDPNLPPAQDPNPPPAQDPNPPPAQDPNPPPVHVPNPPPLTNPIKLPHRCKVNCKKPCKGRCKKTCKRKCRKPCKGKCKKPVPKPKPRPKPKPQPKPRPKPKPHPKPKAHPKPKPRPKPKQHKKSRGKRSPDMMNKGKRIIAGCRDHISLPFDAVEEVHDGSILGFKGPHVYQLTERGPIQTVRLIGEVFQGAPKSPDAVVYDRSRRQTFIFKAKTYWRYTGYRLDAGYPRSLPTAFQGFSAAVERDGAIYLFKGKQVMQWRESWPSLPNGSPRNSSDVWKNLPPEVNAAFKSSSGDFYFFKGQSFWRYDSQGFLRHGFPTHVKPSYWCNSRKLLLKSLMSLGQLIGNIDT